MSETASIRGYLRHYIPTTKLTQVVALPPIFSMAKFYLVPLTYVIKMLLFQLLKRVNDVKHKS